MSGIRIGGTTEFGGILIIGTADIEGGGPGRVLCGVRTGVDGRVIVIGSLVGVIGGVGTIPLDRSDEGRLELSGFRVSVWVPSIFVTVRDSFKT